MSEVKLVNYGELDCKLSDYLATDGVVIKTDISLSDMVDDILKLVNECSYPDTKIQTLEAKVKELVNDNNEADVTIEKYFNRAKSLEALLIEACEKINEETEGMCSFLNKPEIKKLLEGGE